MRTNHIKDLNSENERPTQWTLADQQLPYNGIDGRSMLKKNTTLSEYQTKLGQNVVLLIKQKGYKSVYDFWVNCAGERISRASLNYLAAGKGDPKLSTLVIVADLLEMPVKNILP